LAFRPLVIRKPRSRAACQIALALYQVSTSTWVRVPATGSKVRIRSAMMATLLRNGTPSAAQTACWR
jgi:hypothetical protein